MSPLKPFATLPASLRYGLGGLCLALAYVLAGRLGLLLAVPPGFVTPIFPALGIAVGAVILWGYPMLWGVLLGSTVLNLSLGISSLTELSWAGLPVALGIALGSTAQCLLAAWAIRRWLGADNPLQDERSIFLWLLLAGPLACLISALVGPSVLWLAEIISTEKWLFSAWTWWLGDSLGVMLVAPVMLMLFGKPAPLWRPRLLSVALPLLVSCAIMVFIFLRASAVQQERVQLEFEQQAKLLFNALESRLNRYGTVLHSIERFFTASTFVSAQDFSQFTEEMNDGYPGLIALTWNPLVQHYERAALEERLQSMQPGFAIKEFTPDGRLALASPRAQYVVLAYMNPLQGNERALGIDVSTEPIRNAALEYARDKGKLAMTAPITLVNNAERKLGVLLFYPAYWTAPSALNEEQRGLYLRGFAVAAIQVQRLIEATIHSYTASADNFMLTVKDSQATQNTLLFGDDNYRVPAYAEDLRQVATLNFGGRALTLQLLPSASFLQHQQSLQPWLLLTTGLLLCSLLGAFLLAISGRAQAVAEQVRERTFEITSVLNNAAEGIIIMNASGQFLRANPAAQQLLALGGNASKTNLQDVLREVVSVPELLSAGLEERVEWQMRDLHQCPLDIEVSLSSYLLPNGLRYVAMLRDISSRKQIERMKREFVATVSHELRTPLTSIKGSLGLLAGGVGGELNEQALQLINISRSNADRLVSLVNDILDIERLELGHKQLELAEYSVAELLNQALVLNAGYASSYKVQLHSDCAELNDAVRISVDAQALQQVLSNLISNAVKFSPEGDSVMIRGRLHDNRVHVAVVDHGPGIPQEFHGRIFAKFAQADSSDTRRRGGTGLGLSISKALIEAMGGEIGFTSREGQGSTFYFELPLAEQA
ncbi:Signal transduction histidine kinase [Atopomonas hussainii]|uniref:histidine kinase n=1 Tax=Atopomonas hussainii TaxID=1429083 RepID=A0A1H7P7U6_9GAMM|nr:CHASE domain-containing protein [Atopomonas hussainii]SEL31832.1 Signal transduction histidine kinase [Atopomonas hussainii]